MMRAAVISTLVFVPLDAGASDDAGQKVEKPAECQSCTGRHKSLQALQKALTAEKPGEDMVDETDVERVDD